MEPFAAFADSALQARLKRLQRAEFDLKERLQTRGIQAEAEGRWVPSDPMYQRLSSVLRQVRSDLLDIESEHLRRTAVSAKKRLPA